MMLRISSVGLTVKTVMIMIPMTEKDFRMIIYRSIQTEMMIHLMLNNRISRNPAPESSLLLGAFLFMND